MVSHYTECKTSFKSKAALIKALVEVGFREDQIELHEEAVNLYGYQGDKRAQKANIVIRRQNVGSASNDIGFARQSDGTYKTMISDYDQHAYGKAWMDKLKCAYTKHLTVAQLKAKGCMVTEQKNQQGQTVLVGYLPAM